MYLYSLYQTLTVLDNHKAAYCSGGGDIMTTNLRKPKASASRAYTVRNIYRSYSSDEEKTANLAKLANGIVQIITAKQQKRTVSPMGKFK